MAMNFLLNEIEAAYFAQLYLKFYGNILREFFFSYNSTLKSKMHYAKIDIFFHLSAICRHHQRKSRIAKYVEVHERNYKSCMASAGGLVYRSPCCLAWHIERFSSRGCTNGINVALVSFRARISGRGRIKKIKSRADERADKSHIFCSYFSLSCGATS